MTMEEQVKAAKALQRSGRHALAEVAMAIGAKWAREDGDPLWSSLMMMRAFGPWSSGAELSEFDASDPKHDVLMALSLAWSRFCEDASSAMGLEVTPGLVDVFERQADEEAKVAAERAREEFWRGKTG